MLVVNFSIEDALEHYGLGPGVGDGSRCRILAEPLKRTCSMLTIWAVTANGGDARLRTRVELPIGELKAVEVAADTVMLEMPRVWLAAFGLEEFELSDDAAEHFAAIAELRQPPYLKQTPAGKPETVGGVRV